MVGELRVVRGNWLVSLSGWGLRCCPHDVLEKRQKIIV